MPARERLLWPGEAALLFGVAPKAVIQWAKRGQLPFVRTLGGQHRFPESALVRALADRGHPDPQTAILEVLHRRQRRYHRC